MTVAVRKAVSSPVAAAAARAQRQSNVAGRSFRGRLWRLPEVSASDVRAMAAAGSPPAVAPILVARGLSVEAAKAYLDPTLKELLPSPFVFRDMEKAVDRLEKALRAQEQIALWGDYDVDGATSSALMIRFLRACGAEPLVHIPDRVKEGYGPNTPGLLRLRSEGASVVVILDSGTVAFEQIEAAQKAGLDCVVVDHHLAEDHLPPALAVINPNRRDQAPGFGHVCAVGMAFMLGVALNARLRDGGFFEGRATKPDLMELLDLVALGTVADVVPLTTINRAFVKRGLAALTRRKNAGVAALTQAAALEGGVDAVHCGFVLGPRINAGGRVGDPGAGAALLSSDDPAFCRNLAKKLDVWNAERRDIEKQCVADAIAQVERQGRPREIVFAIGDDWHEGVIGIVASRLKEIYDRPAFVFTKANQENAAKGSARGVRGFHIGEAVIEARQGGMLLKGGGHAMAAGVTVSLDRYEAFHDFLCAKVRASEFGRLGMVADIDLTLPSERVSIGLIDSLTAMEPYGAGNPQPRVLLTGATLVKADVLKDKLGNPVHLRIELESPLHARTKGIAFNIMGSPLAEGLLKAVGCKVEVLGTLDVNEWRDTRTPQIRFEDARLAE